jgi:cytochrome c peroxidase
MPRARWAQVLAWLALVLGCSRGGAPPVGIADNPAAIDSRLRTPFAPLPPPQPVDAARVQLGKALFRDPRLSADGKVSCSTCHDVARGGDDDRPVAIGIGGKAGRLNTPTVLNSSLSLAQFWDGRAATLEDQISWPLQSPIEMGSSLERARAALAADPSTVRRFAAAYADGLTSANLVDALVTYERALLTPGSPFDRYLAGDSGALTPAALEGFELFQRLGCVSCHQGRNLGGNMYQRFGVMGDYFSDRGRVTEADFGRYNVTGREQDRYRFKVPTLRNVAVTAPYFHDGSTSTLNAAVAIMLRYQLGRPVREEEVAKLVAFLESLTGELDPELL